MVHIIHISETTTAHGNDTVTTLLVNEKEVLFVNKMLEASSEPLTDCEEQSAVQFVNSVMNLHSSFVRCGG